MLTEGLGIKDGIVFNIQRYSIHDGPGIRTIVFLKGCPLGCLWCSNPESQCGRPEIMHNAEKCQLCLRCIEACKTGARAFDGKRIVIDREKCQGCGACAEVCPTKASKLIGRNMTVDEIVDNVELDRVFYEESGGGVTLSGGEPLQQGRFAENILKACKDRFIHTAMETTGYAPWSIMERLAKNCDLILFDYKHTDPEKHRKFTGVSNELIKENLRNLIASEYSVIVRVPVIPGFNDDPGDFDEMGAFLKSCGYKGAVHILPYHEFGKVKYERLDRGYEIEGPGMEHEDTRLKRASEILRTYGYEVEI